VQTASELLEKTPPAPLAAILVARPVRACVFVPSVEGVRWERMVEHALGTQARIWGGNQNLIVPLGWEVADEELFWRLVDRCDPDVVALHAPTLADVEEIAPDVYGDAVQRIDQGLRDAGFNDNAVIAREIDRRRDGPFWSFELSEALRTKLVERLAPLHLDAADPRPVHLDGTNKPPYPMTDLLALKELPTGVLDVTSTLGDVDRLILTHAVGRLIPSFKRALEDRGVTSNQVRVEHEAILLSTAWPRHSVVTEFGYPRLLSELGLARRLAFADRDKVIVVVGDDRRDFFLFHGLSRLRPYVFWIPAARLDNQAYVDAIAEAVRFAVRGAGVQQVHVTTASSPDAAAAAIALLEQQRGRQMPEPTSIDWRDTIPLSPLWAGDARSERRVALLRYEGETQELLTPTPVSVSPTEEDLSGLRWMVDVEVQGWRPARHSSLGTLVFQGPTVTAHDFRTSGLGPSYFGLGPLVQAFLGLEGSTARPRLRPLAIVDQVASILGPLGWDIRLSDKGAYALQTARLFGGVTGLATALRDQATRALLDAYMTPTTSNDPGKFLKDTRRRYLSLEEAAGVVGTETDVPALVARLYDLGVLVRGHILKCEYCRATSFYSLTEGQRFTCVRCRTVQKATRLSWLGTPEPEFRYALSEVVFQFLNNHGELPLLAVHDHFVVDRGREREALDVAFELDLVSPDEQLREHDIVATWGAELWLGEATFAKRLERRNADEAERLQRLAETAKALSARGVLFVTSAERFQVATRARIRAAFREPGWPDVVFMEGFGAGASAEG
jgi:hypothetical protein